MWILTDFQQPGEIGILTSDMAAFLVIVTALGKMLRSFGMFWGFRQVPEESATGQGPNMHDKGLMKRWGDMPLERIMISFGFMVVHTMLISKWWWRSILWKKLYMPPPVVQCQPSEIGVQKPYDQSNPANLGSAFVSGRWLMSALDVVPRDVVLLYFSQSKGLGKEQPGSWINGKSTRLCNVWICLGNFWVMSNPSQCVWLPKKVALAYNLLDCPLVHSTLSEITFSSWLVTSSNCLMICIPSIWYGHRPKLANQQLHYWEPNRQELLVAEDVAFMIQFIWPPIIIYDTKWFINFDNLWLWYLCLYTVFSRNTNLNMSRKVFGIASPSPQYDYA